MYKQNITNEKDNKFTKKPQLNEQKRTTPPTNAQ